MTGTIFCNYSDNATQDKYLSIDELSDIMQDTDLPFITFYDKRNDVDLLLNKNFIVSIT